ncbi:MAG: response regulator [Bacteroidales bacterium]
MKRSDFTILVADDDPDYLFLTVTNLEKYGYRTRTFKSQAEAESYISALKPDRNHLTPMMENDDSGFILCYRLKRKYPEVPVILATAVARRPDFHSGFGE